MSNRMPKRPRTSSPERLDHARPASSSSSASGAPTTARIASRPRTRTGTGGESQNRLKYKSKREIEPTRSHLLPIRSLEGSLSEEVLLRCLSFLSAHDLVTVARVSSAWYRLAQDPQLWRNLYFSTYASAATRRQAAFGAVPLPRSRPWRELYQISTNWRNGTARATTLGTELRKAVLPPVPSSTEVVDDARGAVQGHVSVARTVEPVNRDDDTLLQFHHQYIFSASRSGSAVTVHETRPNGSSSVIGSFESTRICQRAGVRPALSEMRLDGSSSSFPMMALFYSTGQYALFRLDLASSTPRSRLFSATEVYTSPSPSFRSDPVATARMHWPLLVTLTDSLTLRFLRLSGNRESGPVQVDETETPLQSRERWSPVILSLARADEARASRSRDDDTERFSVSLAYSTPVFPASWTVGIQHFEVAVSPARLKVLRAQHATAPPAHTPWPSTLTRTRFFGAGADVEDLSNSTTRKSPVTSIEHSHPFIVTSRTDNTIDVYEVVRLEAPAPSLGVVHRRTLFGHTARVSSVALLPTADAGSSRDATAPIRCISAGDDGAVKVWRLLPSEEDARPGRSGSRRRKRTTAEADLQVQVRRQEDAGAAPDGAQLSDYQQLKRRRTSPEEPARVQRVWVDEDKIVLLQRAAGGESSSGEVQVLRFD